MRLRFKSGATRARAVAWAGWLGFAGVVIGWVLMAGLDGLRTWVYLLSVLLLGGWLMLVRRQPRKIPVLNYHSVSLRPEWLLIPDQVSMTPQAFERQLKYLQRHGYQTLFVSEVGEALAGRAQLNTCGNYVALTFDDGYADNWIAVFPLLRRYGMKATLFVSASFIAEATTCRPTMDQTAETGWGSMDWSGYLTWPELRAMQGSGLVEIQSHGGTHTRVFVEPELKGFVGPKKPNLWLLWKARPETRLGWWRELSQDRALWGHPVFRQASALAQRAYCPDPQAVAHLCAWAKEGDGRLFDKADWEQSLRTEWGRYLATHGDHGSWEEADAYERGVEAELGEARRVLERGLAAKVEVLCWPENAFSEAGEKIARRVGYTATVSNRHQCQNRADQAPGSIVRTFIGSHAAGVDSPLLDFMVFVLELKVFEGWYVLYPLLAVMHQIKKGVFAIRRSVLCRKDYVSIWE